MSTLDVSIVIPAYNEEESATPLYDKLTSVLARQARGVRDREPRFGARAHSSPRSAASAVARLSPAIDAVGARCLGQRSLHDS